MQENSKQNEGNIGKKTKGSLDEKKTRDLVVGDTSTKRDNVYNLQNDEY